MQISRMRSSIFIDINLKSTVEICRNKMKADKKKSLRSSGYAPVNNLEMYYEIHGTGKPIVLLHGSYMTIDLNFKKLIAELVKKRRVIAVEMQGHGRTADIERPYSYKALADDIGELLKYLKIKSADILGYSFGGIVALQTVISYPELIRKIVFVSSVYKYKGYVQEAQKLFPTVTLKFFENTPLKAAYDKVAPNPENWKDWMKKMIAFDATPFDLGKKNIERLGKPALLIFGDNDGVELSHAIELYKLFGGGVFADIHGLPASQLAILPGMTHVSLMEQTKELAELINYFL